MKYSEIINAIESQVESYEGLTFIVTGPQQANTYATGQASPSKHLVILDPPRYTGSIQNMTIQKQYEIDMAFMFHIEQDASFEEAQARVNVADQYATHFLVSLNQNEQGTTLFNNASITNIAVTPWHRFTWNAQNMAGVSLQFNVSTIDTFDYCDLQEGIGEMIIESTFMIS